MMKKRRRARNGVRASSHPPPVKIGRREVSVITHLYYGDEDMEDLQMYGDDKEQLSSDPVHSGEH